MMNLKELPEADKKALKITPAEYRLQRMNQLSKDAKWYRTAIGASLVATCTILPIAIATGDIYAILSGIISLLNVPYFFYKHKSTLSTIEKVKTRHEALKAGSRNNIP